MRKIYVFSLLLLFGQADFCKTAYIIDWPGSIDACVGVWDNFRCAVDTLATKKALEKYGFAVRQRSSFSAIESPDAIICFDTGQSDLLNGLHKFHDVVKVLVTREPPMLMPLNFDRNFHQLFDFVFTWHDGFIDDQKYFKKYFAVWGPMVDDLVDFDRKKLCVMITANKGFSHPQQLYSERKKAIEFFEQFHPDDFDLYGISWENSKYARYKTYKGPIPFVGPNAGGNIDHLRYYKFCICYENSAMPGLITQRIFDCFRAGCVPVYWGAPNIEKYIPRNCFISYHDFNDYKKLYDYMIHMGRNEYENYIINIKTFLSSKQAQLFTIQHFQESFEEIVRRIDQKLIQSNQRGKAEL